MRFEEKDINFYDLEDGAIFHWCTYDDDDGGIFKGMKVILPNDEEGILDFDDNRVYEMDDRYKIIDIIDAHVCVDEGDDE